VRERSERNIVTKKKSKNCSGKRRYVLVFGTVMYLSVAVVMSCNAAISPHWKPSVIVSVSTVRLTPTAPPIVERRASTFQ
jgi:hypothetical protein